MKEFEFQSIHSKGKFSQNKITGMGSIKSFKSVDPKKNSKDSRNKKKRVGTRISLIKKIDDEIF